MDKHEWYSLKPGSIVANNKGKNPRVVISVSTSGGIRLPSTRDRAGQGYTVYCSGDKYMFKLVKNPDQVINNYQIY